MYGELDDFKANNQNNNASMYSEPVVNAVEQTVVEVPVPTEVVTPVSEPAPVIEELPVQKIDTEMYTTLTTIAQASQEAPVVPAQEALVEEPENDDDLYDKHGSLKKQAHSAEEYAQGAKFSILEAYGENLSKKTYVTNPAIAREKEIKETIMILLTPDKSALLVGKPGIGKTAIIEGIGYKMQQGDIPNALKGYDIIKVNVPALLGNAVSEGQNENRLQ